MFSVNHLTGFGAGGVATQTLIGSGVGTVIGDMTAYGGIAAAFDGDTTQSVVQGSGKGGTPSDGYVGKDWGASSTKNLTGYIVYGPNNTGHQGGGGGTCTLELRGHSSAPASGSDGTLLHTSSGVDAASSSVVTTVLSGLTAGSYRYHWIRLVRSAGSEIYIAEVEFFETV